MMQCNPWLIIFILITVFLFPFLLYSCSRFCCTPIPIFTVFLLPGNNWLSREFLGRGIMTRSVRTLCDFAFRELDINRIQIKCAVANTASRNIPQRLGFQLEGIERAGELLSGGVFTDLAVYSRLKGDG